MKKGKFGLALFSALVLLAVLGMALHRVPEPVSGPPVAIRAGEETLNVWTEDGETYVAFLPGHVAFGEVAVKPVQEGAMVDGRTLPLSGSALEPDRSYELTWQENGEDRRGTLRLLPSAGMAALFLDTQSGSMDHIHDQKGNAERGTLRLYDETGCLDFSGSFASLRGRGNSTWEVPEKKPYALDLSDEADLLGMGIGKNWILLADAMDASGLRNRIAYDFATQLGMAFVPQLRWTEVYLNGDYAGLYLLCQRIEAEPGSALADLPHMADDRFPQWYRQDTGEIWNLSDPVWEDLDLDTVPPEPKTEEHKEEGLRDLILRVYHYVPVAVLLLMGLVLVPVGLWKSRSRQGQKEKTKV